MFSLQDRRQVRAAGTRKVKMELDERAKMPKTGQVNDAFLFEVSRTIRTELAVQAMQMRMWRFVSERCDISKAVCNMGRFFK